MYNVWYAHTFYLNLNQKKNVRFWQTFITRFPTWHLYTLPYPPPPPPPPPPPMYHSLHPHFHLHRFESSCDTCLHSCSVTVWQCRQVDTDCLSQGKAVPWLDNTTDAFWKELWFYLSDRLGTGIQINKMLHWQEREIKCKELILIDLLLF